VSEEIGNVFGMSGNTLIVALPKTEISLLVQGLNVFFKFLFIIV